MNGMLVFARRHPLWGQLVIMIIDQPGGYGLRKGLGLRILKGHLRTNTSADSLRGRKVVNPQLRLHQRYSSTKKAAR